ncbi:MAG: UDP-N-acetylmuramoyl-tripeptide--D-alanyl-D-alanine ligase [Candidatus Kapabacteria bacterium]|nr:UDP-N-acetylmuramoyl-tripeptide--D-alanyl-D-alanine ligase [Candidatus Kapabacteria bacterium]
MLPNNATFDTTDLMTIFSPEKCRNFGNFSACTGISIDTRDIANSNIFIALKGEKQDGHSRIAEAFERGAAACVVSDVWYRDNSTYYPDKSFITVDDTLKALGDIANFHRERFNIPIVAIGGANGKTTTKEITSHILAKKYNLLKTFENFNNRLGVPLMLLQLTNEHEVAVLEMGTSEPGEVQILAQMIEPTIGLITNIGEEHLENLIDLDGVEIEETALYGYLIKSGGLALINADDERLYRYCKVIEHGFLYGNVESQNNLQAATELDSTLTPTISMKYDGKETQITLKTRGYTTALNATAAAAVALNLGFTLDEVKSALESFENNGSFNHSYGRMAVDTFGKAILINDCYNANPNSMTAALEVLNYLATDGRKHIILGDMLELGDATEEAHRRILELACSKGDKVFLYGKYFAKAAAELGNSKATAFDSHEDLCRALTEISPANSDVFLVKGSRSMKMENIVNHIVSHLNAIK